MDIQQALARLVESENLAMEEMAGVMRQVMSGDATQAQIGAFPAPATHASPQFLTEHGPMASAEATNCSVCHARESCTVCHVNAEKVPAIMALGPDPPPLTGAPGAIRRGTRPWSG